MVILGINYVFHDSSACILVGGKLVAALEEERFTRNKHVGVFPQRSIDKCLEIANLTIKDIDHIAYSFEPTLDLFNKVKYMVKHPSKALSIFKLQILRFYWRYRTISKWYKSTFNGIHRPELHWVPHHESHVVGGFYASPYQNAALLSMDGSGEWATTYLGYGDGIRYEEYNQTYFPNSMGSIYEAVTAFCGFIPAYDEGKTMGLASLGNARSFIDEARKVVDVSEQGNINIDLSYFNFQYCEHHYFSDKFFRVFGKPREKNQELSQHYMDVAAAFQQLLEEVSLKLCKILRQQTDTDYLVIAGGVALNSVMNGRIVRESGFKDIYVMPAAGDNGTAIGAAYYTYNKTLGFPRKHAHMDPYLGTAYSNEEIETCLNECKLSYEYHENIESITAQLLSEENIIGWFQGRMEIGPRALGNRSILADPSRPNMKDKINAEVKHREPFRPFAPSVIAERKSEFFDIQVEAPFMLKVCDVIKDKMEILPAITHVDGSARVHTVTKDVNPRYHKLITEFGRITGVPVVLNTSFNVMGEPIVESPMQAIRCFFSTGLDILILGNYLIKK